MRKRDRTGLALAPIFLRFALALTFIWAGLGKFMSRMEVQGEQAAILANYGVIPNPHAPMPRPPAEAPTDEPTPAQPDEDAGTGTDGQAAAGSVGQGHLAAFQTETPVLAIAADFPEPVSVRAWAGLVLMLHGAIHPGHSSEDSAPLMPLWPDLDPGADYDPWPRYAALTVALTELVGGILIGLGLLTRLAGLGVAGVMVGAMWLTVVGPAVQSGKTVFGFLPNHGAFDPEAWMMPMWQLTLCCCALALFFAGPGTMSLDRLLLGGPPKPAPPKPPAPAPKK